MSILTPKIQLPILKLEDAVWLCVGIYTSMCLYLAVMEWQRNKLFKVTQDRLTLAYETHVYSEVRKAYENGPIHDGTTIQPTVDDNERDGESLSTQVDKGAQPNGYVPYRIGSPRSLANVDENPEGVDND